MDEVGAEVVGELGEERLGLGLCQGAHCGGWRGVSRCCSCCECCEVLTGRTEAREREHGAR